MLFDVNDNRWSSSFISLGLEINLGGDVDGVFPINEEMSVCIEQNIRDISEEAIAYVAKHVNVNSAICGTPELQWIDFGLSNYGEHNEFELFFNDSNTYTLWGVRFNYNKLIGKNPWSPVGFSRRAW